MRTWEIIKPIHDPKTGALLDWEVLAKISAKTEEEALEWGSKKYGNTVAVRSLSLNTFAKDSLRAHIEELERKYE